MITSILEYRFSDHYFRDTDNRFKLRVKDAEILNDFKDKNKAVIRFRQVMYHFLLTQLDKMRTESAIKKNFGLIFGEIVFIENGNMQPGIIKVDNNNIGNIYVSIIKDETVVSLLLFKNTLTNEEILNKLNEHEKRSNSPALGGLKNMNNLPIKLESKMRPKITINLDISDSEFYSKYNSPVLINNKYSNNSFSEDDAKKLKNIEITAKKDAPIMSGTIIPTELTQYTAEKEWVINKGTKILIKYPEGIKEKTLDEIIVDETGTPRKFSLRFQNTLKPYSLNIGENFIITPTQMTTTFMKLINMFGLKLGHNFSFEGPIVRFMDYRKRTGGIGIVISPKKFY